MPNKRIVCYYRVEENFRPYDLDACLCTHVIYSYVAVKENLSFIAGKKGKRLIEIDKLNIDLLCAGEAVVIAAASD